MWGGSGESHFLMYEEVGMRKCWQSTLWVFGAEAGRRLDKTWKETEKRKMLLS